MILAAGNRVGFAQTKSTTPIVKEDCFGFDIDKLQVKHQGGAVLTFNVLYRYAPGLKTSEYMDVRQLRNYVLNSMKNYPNTTDYWEILSAKLADGLYAKYANQLDCLRFKLTVAPNKGTEPFTRTSLVIRSRPGAPPLIP